jgi:predicted phage tail protein
MNFEYWFSPRSRSTPASDEHHYYRGLWHTEHLSDVSVCGTQTEVSATSLSVQSPFEASSLSTSVVCMPQTTCPRLSVYVPQTEVSATSLSVQNPFEAPSPFTATSQAYREGC